MRFTRDSITHITAFPTCQASFIVGNGFTNKTNQQFIRIGTSFIDFQSRMSAAQSFQCYFHCNISFFRSHLFIFQSSSDIHTSGTTDIQFTFIFRIQIQQDFPIHRTRFQTERTIHPGLFILSDQSFQRTVFQIFCFQHGHDSSYPQSVVRTQSCTFRFYPVTVYISFNRIFFKIVYSIVVLLGSHIHVRLKNHAFAIFHTRSCRLTYNHVACFVYKRFQS